MSPSASVAVAVIVRLAPSTTVAVAGKLTVGATLVPGGCRVMTTWSVAVAELSLTVSWKRSSVDVVTAVASKVGVALVVSLSVTVVPLNWLQL